MPVPISISPLFLERPASARFASARLFKALKHGEIPYRSSVSLEELLPHLTYVPPQAHEPGDILMISPQDYIEKGIAQDPSWKVLEYPATGFYRIEKLNTLPTTPQEDLPDIPENAITWVTDPANQKSEAPQRKYPFQLISSCHPEEKIQPKAISPAMAQLGLSGKVTALALREGFERKKPKAGHTLYPLVKAYLELYPTNQVLGGLARRKASLGNVEIQTLLALPSDAPRKLIEGAYQKVQASLAEAKALLDRKMQKLNTLSQALKAAYEQA